MKKSIILTLYGIMASTLLLAQYKIKMASASSLMSNQETFIFSIGGNDTVSMTMGSPVKSFKRSFRPGETYTVTQVSGPRQSQILEGSGTVSNKDIIVSANCGHPPLTNFTITITGVGTGEHFKFADNYNRTFGFPVSVDKYTLSSYPLGDQYIITQQGGPRQCSLYFNKGTVPATTVNVIADCAKKLPPVVQLVSISYDKQRYGTYYGSVTPGVGGVPATGVVEDQYITYMTSWKMEEEHGGKYRQIIWHNRGNGRNAVVSQTPAGKGGNGDSYEPVIDVTGHNVAFQSHASDLLPEDGNKFADVFVWSLMSTSVTMVSQGANAASGEPSISKGGEYIAFSSYASTLTPDVNATTSMNVYLKNMRTGQVTLISKDYETGKAVGGRHPSISEDGSRIAFYSYSNRLVPGDTNNLWDIFVWERGKPAIKKVSFTANGTDRNQGSESMSRIVKPALSGNGKYVAYATTATNMLGGESTTWQDVFVVEVETGHVVRASENRSGEPGDKDSPIVQGERIAISYDGAWVAFPTAATNLGGNMIVKNIQTGEIKAYGTAGQVGVGNASLSRSGSCVVFPVNEKLDGRYNTTGVFSICQ